MDSTTGDTKERGGSGRDNKRSISKIIYRDYYELEDRTSLHILLEKYWTELFSEDIDEFIWLGQNRGEPYRINKVEVQLNRWLLEDRAGIKVAELDNKIIGFMVYHYFFGCYLVVRGIYFLPEYRNRGLMARIILSVGYVRRVISQTLSKHEPKEIIGEKKNRKLLREFDGKRVWEFRLSPGNRRLKDGNKP